MIYKIHHYAFATDDVKPTISLVEADSKEEALDKYNKLATTRTEYPYCWNQVSLNQVYEADIIK